MKIAENGPGQMELQTEVLLLVDYDKDDVGELCLGSACFPYPVCINDMVMPPEALLLVDYDKGERCW